MLTLQPQARWWRIVFNIFFCKIYLRMNIRIHYLYVYDSHIVLFLITFFIFLITSYTEQSTWNSYAFVFYKDWNIFNDLLKLTIQIFIKFNLNELFVNLIFIFNKGHILDLYRKKWQNMAVSGGGVYDNICGGGGLPNGGGSHFGGGGIDPGRNHVNMYCRYNGTLI